MSEDAGLSDDLAVDDDLDADGGDDDVDDGGGDDDGAEGNRVPAAHAQAVLAYLVGVVVEEPDGVEVDAEQRRAGLVSLEVRVAPGDMGRVIGKRGRVANAIRTVVRAAAVRDDVDVDVEFVD